MSRNRFDRPTFVRVFLLSSACACLAVASEPSPEASGSRIAETPDLPQVQQELPRRGGAYCGPVSASNALVWLAHRGYPDLLPENQVALAKELGAPALMRTHERNGTGANGIMGGLVEYIEACGYAIDELDYQGWRPLNSRFKRVPGQADPQRLADKLQPGSIVLLNLGWYEKQGDQFERKGGHWVTLVGAQGSDLPTLIIHDPSSRSPEGDHERVAVSQIDGGRLVGSSGGLPTEATGAWELGGELKIKTRSGANTSVLDGAVVLRLE